MQDTYIDTDPLLFDLEAHWFRTNVAPATYEHTGMLNHYRVVYKVLGTVARTVVPFFAPIDRFYQEKSRDFRMPRLGCRTLTVRVRSPV